MSGWRGHHATPGALLALVAGLALLPQARAQPGTIVVQPAPQAECARHPAVLSGRFEQVLVMSDLGLKQTFTTSGSGLVWEMTGGELQPLPGSAASDRAGATGSRAWREFNGWPESGGNGRVVPGCPIDDYRLVRGKLKVRAELEQHDGMLDCSGKGTVNYDAAKVAGEDDAILSLKGNEYFLVITVPDYHMGVNPVEGTCTDKLTGKTLAMNRDESTSPNFLWIADRQGTFTDSIAGRFGPVAGPARGTQVGASWHFDLPADATAR